MTTVIYHSADYDGIFCREIAKHFLGPERPKIVACEGVRYIGWNFGDPPVQLLKERTYILDLSPDCLLQHQASPDQLKEYVIWIDHHKTSIDKWASEIPGYRIDGVAACRLAWQWFSKDHTDPIVQFNGLPDKQDFIDRKVSEPLAVRLAGEYDIWDKRDPRGETFQYALRVREPNFRQLLGEDSAIEVKMMLEAGEVAQTYQLKIDADLVAHRSYRLNWEGLNFIVLNTGRFNSLTFAALDKPETGHDALLGYMFNGKCWTVSLYHAQHNTGLDLSEIAKKHGGGGHRGACGFTCDKLPFMA